MTDAQGNATVTAKLPDNLTTFRVMAVAVTAGDRYGKGQSSLLVTRPLLARQADKFTLIRSVGVKPKGLRNHGAAIYMLMTGHDPGNFSPTGLAVPPSREDLPSVGSVTSRYRPAAPGAVADARPPPLTEGLRVRSP